MFFSERIIRNFITLTENASDSILSFYKKNKIEISFKNNDTLVTDADILSHNIITKGLQTITPNIPIISEENCVIPFSKRKNWSEFWLIDPIDGTRGFVNKTNDFCICLSYIKHNEPVFALIYDSITKIHYIANSKTQAFKIHNDDWRPLKALKARTPLKVVVGKYSLDKPNVKQHLLTHTNGADYDMKGIGSALKFCLIADGQYDYYPGLGTCCEWDTAAGSFILKSAGGNVIDFNKKKLLYNTKEDFVSPIFFASGDFVLSRN